MHNKKFNLIAAASVFLILGAVYIVLWNGRKMSGDMPDWKQETQKDTNADKEAESISAMDGSVSVTKDENRIYVYVCGFVNEPGVYALHEDSRMFEAVEMAGGISEGGCADYLELASVLADGMRIYVPSVEEAEQAIVNDHAGTDAQGRININKASREELMTLPGIGEAKADAIIRYREANGQFTVIEDIMNISGIKEAAFSKIRDYICAEP